MRVAGLKLPPLPAPAPHRGAPAAAAQPQGAPPAAIVALSEAGQRALDRTPLEEAQDPEEERWLPGDPDLATTLLVLERATGQRLELLGPVEGEAEEPDPAKRALPPGLPPAPSPPGKLHIVA